MVHSKELSSEEIVDMVFKSYVEAVERKRAAKRVIGEGIIPQPNLNLDKEEEKPITYSHYLTDVVFYGNVLGQIDNIAKSFFECWYEKDELSQDVHTYAKRGFVAEVLKQYVDLKLVVPIEPDKFDSEEGKNRAGELHQKVRAIKEEGLVSILGDVKNTEIKKLKKHSVHDWLTGLYNKQYFEERLAAEVERVKRRKEKEEVGKEKEEMGEERDASTVCMILFDIDDFTWYNSIYDHPVGDVLLSYVAEALQKDIRKTDLVARCGGEEFGMILTDVLPKKAYEIAVDRINRVRTSATRRFAEYIDKTREKGEDYPAFVGEVTISAGVSWLGNKTYDSDEMVRHADNPLYLIKVSGKNDVACYDPQLDKEGKYRWAREEYDKIKNAGKKNGPSQTKA